MTKKELVIVLLIFSLLLISLVAAQNETGIDKAYSCLKNKVSDRGCEDLTVEEQAFSLLALAYDSSSHADCKSALLDEMRDDDSWEGKLKQTALAVLALNYVNYNTEDSEDWLLTQKKVPSELDWFLEIDSTEATECKISYEGTDRTIKIGEDKKINRAAGSCLSLSEGSYWLKIKSTCYETNFTISCDKDFVTTLIYTKKSGSTYYVSSTTNSAPAEGETEERVNAFCLKQGSSCDYEGTLWGALALSVTGHDKSEFLPYLIALAEDNEQYLPSAFLYKLTGYDEYFSTLVELQKSSKYWQARSQNNKLYDTALALLALQSVSGEQADNAKQWLLDIQPSEGCWGNSIRDTAFILHAGWPKPPTSAGGEPTVTYCEDYSYFCTSPGSCLSSDTLGNYHCASSLEVCCRTEPVDQTCSDKNGIVCQSGQQCTGSTVTSSDTSSCCLGSCLDSSDETECASYSSDYSCKVSCGDDEESLSYTCDFGDVCCAPKSSPNRSWIWIIILLILLIILVVLAIIFRDQLKIWFFKIKNKFQKGPASPQTRPSSGFPPSPPSGIPRMMPRRIFPPQRRPMPRRPMRAPPQKSSAKDRELDETLRKLREMSK